MPDRSLSKEIGIGLGLGLVTNLIWVAISTQFNIYVVTLIFVGVAGIYYLVWLFILKPLQVVRNLKIKEVYKSFADVKSIIKQKLQNASSVKIISVGGGAIVRDDRGEILDLLAKAALRDAQIKILLLDPYSHVLHDRVKELQVLTSRNWGSERLSHDITTSAQTILTRSDKIEVRYYASKPVWRLYNFGEVAFVSFYLGDKEGHETQVMVIEKGSDFFTALERIFDSLWQQGAEPSIDIAQIKVGERQQKKLKGQSSP